MIPDQCPKCGVIGDGCLCVADLSASNQESKGTLTITDELKAEAQHLRNELHGQYGAGRITFVGVGATGFVVGFVLKRDLKAVNKLKTWYGKPIDYLYTGAIRALTT